MMSWENRLLKKAVLGSPVVEQTPVIWKDRLLLVETWQTHWDNPLTPRREYYVRIRDEETNKILGRYMNGYGLASAFVWNNMFYIFATRAGYNHNRLVSWNNVYMSKSEDLVHWTEPTMVIEQELREHIFNQSVCYDGRRFVMAYETDLQPAFTIKFAESSDLEHWQKIPGAIYGTDRYTACPAIRFIGGYYYMLYLEHLKPRWWFETWLTRSKDLKHWEDALHNPVIAPNPTQSVHPDCPPHPGSAYREACADNCPANGKEINTSDPDLVEWQGKVRVYFTGGCQHWGGLLQYAEFDGTMQEFFESYYQDF